MHEWLWIMHSRIRWGVSKVEWVGVFEVTRKTYICKSTFRTDLPFFPNLTLKLRTRRSDHCMDAFTKNYQFANQTVSMLLGCEEKLVEWGPPLGPPVNE